MDLADCVYGADAVAVTSPGGWERMLAEFVAQVEFLRRTHRPQFDWKAYCAFTGFDQDSLRYSEFLTDDGWPGYAYSATAEWSKLLLFLSCFRDVGGHVVALWTKAELWLQRRCGFWELIQRRRCRDAFARCVVDALGGKRPRIEVLLPLIGSASPEIAAPEPVPAPLVNTADNGVWDGVDSELHVQAEIGLGRWCLLSWAADLASVHYRWPPVFAQIEHARMVAPLDFEAIYIDSLDPHRRMAMAQRAHNDSYTLVSTYDELVGDCAEGARCDVKQVEEAICRRASVRVLGLASRALGARIRAKRSDGRKPADAADEAILLAWIRRFGID